MRPEKRTQARIGHEGGRWDVRVRNGAENTAQALWLSLGRCGEYRTALRLYMSLLGGRDRR